MGYARRAPPRTRKGRKGKRGKSTSTSCTCVRFLRHSFPNTNLIAINSPGQLTGSGFPSSTGMQGALVPMGGPDISSSASASQPNHLNGSDGAVGAHTGGLPFTPTSILPARPNLPDDPVIPHNGFVTTEEGEKAFIHLLRKAGVDANWTWDQTMRAIITDPLYKALNTLAEKKATWQKVRLVRFLVDAANILGFSSLRTT
jgi:pre-mRNA-processing factor 40